jgi:hypothetical protein
MQKPKESHACASLHRPHGCFDEGALDCGLDALEPCSRGLLPDITLVLLAEPLRLMLRRGEIMTGVVVPTSAFTQKKHNGNENYAVETIHMY